MSRARQATNAAYPDNGSDNWVARPFFEEGYESAERDFAPLLSLVKKMRHAQKEFARTRITGWNYEIQRTGKEIDSLLESL